MYLSENRRKVDQAGFTLVEVMVAAMLVAVFFASLFELNAVCIRYVSSSKDSLAALQLVNDRAESLRNYAFSDLTRLSCDPCVPVYPNTTCVTIPCIHDLMATPANASPFSSRATEVVTISNYPATANGVTQFTRSADGVVTTNSLRTDPISDLVKIDVSVSWIRMVGGNTGVEQTSCIVSNGTKK